MFSPSLHGFPFGLSSFCLSFKNIPKGSLSHFLPLGVTNCVSVCFMPFNGLKCPIQCATKHSINTLKLIIFQYQHVLDILFFLSYHSNFFNNYNSSICNFLTNDIIILFGYRYIDRVVACGMSARMLVTALK